MCSNKPLIQPMTSKMAITLDNEVDSKIYSITIVNNNNTKILMEDALFLFFTVTVHSIGIALQYCNLTCCQGC